MSGQNNILLSYGAAAAGNGLLQDLQAYWRCKNSDISGSTLVDIHNTFDGTITAATTGAQGIIDEAILFDAINEYVNFGNVLNAEFSQPFSISMWLKPLAANYNDVLHGIGKRETSGNWRGYRFDRTASVNGYVMAFSTVSTLSNILSVRGSTPINTVDYYHVVVTYDGSKSATGVQIYVNASADTMTIVQNNLTTSTAGNAPLLIGEWYTNNFSNAIPNHIIDEVGIWYKELSASNVAALCNSMAGLPYPSFTY